MRFFWLFILMSLFLSSCSSNKRNLRDHKGSYLESVRLNFEAGEEALKNKDYDKAILYFQFVRSKYPFSQFAALSDLKVADVKYAQKKWIDAASAYEVFIRLHPRHEQVPYASYRVGVSYFYAIPSDFFLLPKNTSRDQSFTKEALAAIERFILQYPQSEYSADAREKRGLLFSYLAQHNVYIAEYYMRRGRYQAALERYLSVENLYPETSEAKEALFRAAEILRSKLANIDGAIELYTRIVNEQKDSSHAKEAATLLQQLLLEREGQSVEEEPR